MNITHPLTVLSIALSLAACSVPTMSADVRDGDAVLTDASRDTPLSDVSPTDDMLDDTPPVIEDVPFVPDDGSTPWRVDVSTTDAIALGPLERVARIDIIQAPQGSLRNDEVNARIYLPRQPNGSGHSVFRMGECIVENDFAPAAMPIADRFFVRTPRQEIEVTRVDPMGGLSWSFLQDAFTGVPRIDLRAERADFAMPWTFSAPFPNPVRGLAGVEGIDQPGMPLIYRSPGAEFRISWDPTSPAAMVHISVAVYPFVPLLDRGDLSTIHCLYPTAVGSALIRPWSQAGWVWELPDYELYFAVDSIAQYRVPFGGIMAEINMIHRSAGFYVYRPRE